MQRRSFLKSTAMLPAGRLLLAQDSRKIHLGCQTNAWPIDPRDFSNVLSVIEKIKNYGYEGFETGFANVQGQFEHPAEARTKLDALGLKFTGVHIFLTQYDPTTRIAPAELYERVAIGGAALGAERLILSGGGVPSGPGDSAGIKNRAAALNRAAEFAARRRLKFAYHNHAADFEKGGAEIEALLRRTDAAKVGLLLDAGHAFSAGADVPTFVRKQLRRIVGLHLRDFKNGDQVPLGSGDFPLQAVADILIHAGWSGWVLNEEERLASKPGDAAVKPARDALFRAFLR